MPVIYALRHEQQVVRSHKLRWHSDTPSCPLYGDQLVQSEKVGQVGIIHWIAVVVLVLWSNDPLLSGFDSEDSFTLVRI